MEGAPKAGSTNQRIEKFSDTRIKCFLCLECPPIPRQSDHDIPVGWSPCYGIRERSASSFTLDETETRLEGDECLYRCPHTEFRLTQAGKLELVRCSVCVRRSRISDHMKKGKNGRDKHEFRVLPKYDGMLHRSLRNSIQETRSEIYSAELLRLTASFIGRTGIPLAKGCGVAMESLLTDVMNLAFKAQRNAQVQGITLTATDFTCHFGRICLTEELVRLAEEERDKRIQHFRERQYFVNMKIDAGTVLKSHCMHGVLDCAIDMAHSEIILDVEIKENWGTDAYADYLVKKIDQVREDYGLAIASIVHDNLAAQSSAVNRVLTELRPKEMILDVPCQNHVVNLCFVHSIKRSSKLSLLIDKALEYQKGMRKAGLKCPNVPATRWLYIADVIQYITKNKDFFENGTSDDADTPAERETRTSEETDSDGEFRNYESEESEESDTEFMESTEEGDTSDRLSQCTGGSEDGTETTSEESEKGSGDDPLSGDEGGHSGGSNNPPSEERGGSSEHDQGKGKFPTDLLALELILTPLMVFSKSLERSQTALSDVIPLALQLLASWRKAKDEISRSNSRAKNDMMEVLDIIVTNFLALFNNYGYPEMCAAYLLSMRGKGQYHDCGRFGIRDYLAEEDASSNGEAESIDRNDDYCINSSRDMLESLEQDEHAQEKDSRTASKSVQRSGGAKEDFERLIAVKLEQKLENSILLKNSLRLAASSMRTIGTLYERNEAYYYEYLLKWLKEPMEDSTGEHQDCSAEEHNLSWRFWCDRLSMSCFDERTYGDWHDFADLARRYVCAAASEASVERILSKQRAIYGDHTTNIDAETITARLTLYDAGSKAESPEHHDEEDVVVLDLIRS